MDDINIALPSGVNISRHKYGNIPRHLRGQLLSDILHRNIPRLSYILTLLSISKSFDLPPKGLEGIQFITEEEKVNPAFFASFKSYLQRIRKMLPKIPFTLTPLFFHSTKKGPLGNVLDTYFSDYVCQDIISSPLMDEMCKDIENNVILTKVEDLTRIPKLKYRQITTGKIVNFSDKEGKTRYIAIANYFYQSSLLPLHNLLLSLLKLIPSDRTFNQQKVHPKYFDGRFFSSLDLTEATDRMPWSVQLLVLQTLLGLPQDYLDTVTGIFKSPFLFKDKGNTDGVYLNYNMGTPMGLYGSWTTYSLTHHLLLSYCYTSVHSSLCSPFFFRSAPWMILGDDLVIFDRKIHDHYLLVCKHLGVKCSLPKTFLSSIGYEFAKLIYIRGINCSPLPLKGLYHFRSKPFQSILYLFVFRSRWSLSFNIEDLILTLILEFKGISREKLLLLKAWVTFLLYKNKLISGSEFLRRLHDLYTPHLCFENILTTINQEGAANAFLSNICIGLFSENYPEYTVGNFFDYVKQLFPSHDPFSFPPSYNSQLAREEFLLYLEKLYDCDWEGHVTCTSLFKDEDILEVSNTIFERDLSFKIILKFKDCMYLYHQLCLPLNQRSF